MWKSLAPQTCSSLSIQLSWSVLLIHSSSCVMTFSCHSCYWKFLPKPTWERSCSSNSIAPPVNPPHDSSWLRIKFQTRWILYRHLGLWRWETLRKETLAHMACIPPIPYKTLSVNGLRVCPLPGLELQPWESKAKMSLGHIPKLDHINQRSKESCLLDMLGSYRPKLDLTLNQTFLSLLYQGGGGRPSLSFDDSSILKPP